MAVVSWRPRSPQQGWMIDKKGADVKLPEAVSAQDGSDSGRRKLPLNRRRPRNLKECVRPLKVAGVQACAAPLRACGVFKGQGFRGRVCGSLAAACRSSGFGKPVGCPREIGEILAPAEHCADAGRRSHRLHGTIPTKPLQIMASRSAVSSVVNSAEWSVGAYGQGDLR